ncbi:dTMP kinase [bacterium]|nr:dTMP kinase [bacterium]
MCAEVKRGLFITLEGPEGGGKTSQAKAAIEYLQSLGLKAVYSHEPGGTPLSEKIRALLIDPENNMAPLTELLLFEASRCQHVQEFILPHLQEGVFVVCDRFCDSSLAYQGARGLPLEWVRDLNNLCVKGCWPDLTLLLDVGYEAGRERLLRRYEGKAQSFDRIEREKRQFFESLRQNYLNMAQEDIERCGDPLQSRWRLVDAAKDFDSVKEQIRGHIKERLQRGGYLPAEHI